MSNLNANFWLEDRKIWEKCQDLAWEVGLEEEELLLIG